MSTSPAISLSSSPAVELQTLQIGNTEAHVDPATITVALETIKADKDSAIGSSINSTQLTHDDDAESTVWSSDEEGDFSDPDFDNFDDGTGVFFQTSSKIASGNFFTQFEKKPVEAAPALVVAAPVPGAILHPKNFLGGALPREPIDSVNTYTYDPNWAGFDAVVKHGNHDIPGPPDKLDVEQLIQLAVNFIKNPHNNLDAVEAQVYKHMKSQLASLGKRQFRVEKGLHQYEDFVDSLGVKTGEKVSHITVSIPPSKSFHVYFSVVAGRWAYHSISR